MSWLSTLYIGDSDQADDTNDVSCFTNLYIGSLANANSID